MARLLMKNASHIVTCDPSDTVYTDSNLLMEDGVITYIGPEEQQAEEVIDAAGCIVYPGLINTHHHLYQTFSRNLPQVQNLELFDWLKALYEIWKNLDSQVIYHSSVTGMGELMKNGVIHFLPPEECPGQKHLRRMSMKVFSGEQGNFTGLKEFGEVE